MGVPGEGVADDGDRDQEPEVDGEGKAEHDHRQDGADGVQHAGPLAGMRADVVRPEVVKASDLHGSAFTDSPMEARGTSIARHMRYAERLRAVAERSLRRAAQPPVAVFDRSDAA